jgi:hypothetical protein
LQPGHVAMHTDASNMPTNCFILMAIIPRCHRGTMITRRARDFRFADR